jgi:hypothetical protein
MKRIASLLALLLCIGCVEELSPPEIMIDISPVNVGIREISPDTDLYHFDLQLYNLGDKELRIDSVDYRGDQFCSFTFEGPDVWEMGKNESAFIRGWYDPVAPGEDHISMEIVSNADNYPLFVVPICGKAVPAGTTEAEFPVCQIPPAEPANCEDPQ